MNVYFRKAKLKDANEMVNVYNGAFYDDYKRYGTCPGYGHSIECMEKSIRDNTKYTILSESKMIGAISVSNKKDGKCYIGCLCIIPEYQGKGIGTKAMQFLQDELIGWKSFELETPVSKTENVKFYTQKCGFTITDKIKDGDVELYRFIKRAK